MAAREVMSLAEVRKAGLIARDRGSPYLAPGQGRGRWLPLGERHMKEKMSVEGTEKEEDPKGIDPREVGPKRKFLLSFQPRQGKRVETNPGSPGTCPADPDNQFTGGSRSF